VSRALFLDPGVNDLGVAIFSRDTGRLYEARRFEGDGFHDEPERILTFAKEVADWCAPYGPFYMVGCEWPQVYRAGFNPNRLLPLAAMNAAVIAFVWEHTTADCAFRMVRPAQWKGRDKKPVMARKILAAMRPGEEKAVAELDELIADLERAEARGGDLKHPAHNTLDAVGIGLFFLGRLKQRAP